MPEYDAAWARSRGTKGAGAGVIRLNIRLLPVIALSGGAETRVSAAPRAAAPPSRAFWRRDGAAERDARFGGVQRWKPQESAGLRLIPIGLGGGPLNLPDAAVMRFQGALKDRSSKLH